MNNILISVIIPIYNADKYLVRCLESIRHQSYSCFEVIMVDDGSSDNSGEICDQYALKDDRFKVIHKVNEGAGLSRNVGIDKAQGDYIVFIDADDYITPQYFSMLSTHNEDVVFIDINYVAEDGEFLRKENMSNFMNVELETILRCNMTGKLMWGGVEKGC